MSRFEQFIKYRQYLMSVTDNTIRWHRCALKWLPDENPTQVQLQQMVVRMKECGLKETGCNAVIRSVNAYPPSIRTKSESFTNLKGTLHVC